MSLKEKKERERNTRMQLLKNVAKQDVEREDETNKADAEFRKSIHDSFSEIRKKRAKKVSDFSEHEKSKMILQDKMANTLSAVTRKSLEYVIDSQFLTGTVTDNLTATYSDFIELDVLKVSGFGNEMATLVLDGNEEGIARTAKVVGDKLKKHFILFQDRVRYTETIGQTKLRKPKKKPESILFDYLAGKKTAAGDTEAAKKYIGDGLIRLSIVETLNSLQVVDPEGMETVHEKIMK